MTATTDAPSTAPSGRRRGRGWSVVGVLGEIFVTLGVIILLFVGYQLWWTDVLARNTYADTRAWLQQEWGIGDASGRVPATVTPEWAKPFGLMYIPELRDRAWGVPILEGTTQEILQGGVGHHPGSAVPGEMGNVAIAGHRTTYGAPFGDIDHLEPGDQVIIETKTGWYIYQMDNKEIIDFWEGWVLDPVPGKPRNTIPTQELITIYSCHPKFSAAQRYVWFGHLVDKFTKGTGTPPAIDRYGRAA